MKILLTTYLLFQKASTSKAKRLFKCFCGCTELTEDEIKRIYRLSAQETLINKQACDLLHKFLERERSGDKSEAEELLDVYEKCEEMLSEDQLLTEDDIIILSDLGLKYNLEKDLRFQVRTGDKRNIERCLLRIQGICRNEIESSSEYKNFKEAILKKLQS